MALSTRRDSRAARRSIGLRERGSVYTRSESGIGALIPWANKLWLTTYPDENGNGGGMGLFSLDEDGDLELVDETNGTHAGRAASGDYAFIGVHKIHRNGTVTKMTGFDADDRITAWCKVPGQTPDGNGNVWVYALTMGGKIYRIRDSAASGVTYVGNATTGLGIAGQPHFKAMWGTPGRLYVVSNINYPDGRLGYLSIASIGGTLSWTRLDDSVTSAATGISFIEVAGSYDGNGHVFALGQNEWTGYLYLISGTDAADPRVFLIPLTSRQQVRGWQQEWMRIRQADTTERYLMDFHGCYYALSPFLDGGGDFQSQGFPRLEPLGAHTRTTTDWAVFDGKLWLGSNSSSAQSSNKYPNAGQSASILWSVESVDQLISMTRKPRATGWFYRARAVPATTESLPMLTRGYDRKTVLIKNGTGSSPVVTVYGYWGDTKQTLGTVSLSGLEFKTFTIPEGVNPDWVSVSSSIALDPASIWMDLS